MFATDWLQLDDLLPAQRVLLASLRTWDVPKRSPAQHEHSWGLLRELLDRRRLDWIALWGIARTSVPGPPRTELLDYMAGRLEERGVDAAQARAQFQEQLRALLVVWAQVFDPKRQRGDGSEEDVDLPARQEALEEFVGRLDASLLGFLLTELTVGLDERGGLWRGELFTLHVGQHDVWLDRVLFALLGCVKDAPQEEPLLAHARDVLESCRTLDLSRYVSLQVEEYRDWNGAVVDHAVATSECENWWLGPDLRALGCFPNLHSLRLYAVDLDSLQGACLHDLETLEIFGVDRKAGRRLSSYLGSLRGLESAPKLERLHLGCRLGSLEGLRSHPALESMQLTLTSGCGPELRMELACLRHARLHGPPPQIALHAPTLRELEIHAPRDALVWSATGRDVGLESLRIKQALSLERIEGLERLDQLRELGIWMAQKLRAIPALPASLRELWLDDLRCLASLEGLRHASGLEEIWLNIGRDRGELEDLGALEGLRSLQRMRVNLGRARRWEGAQLPALARLEIYSHLESLGGRFDGLEHLELAEFASPAPLEELVAPSLRELVLRSGRQAALEGLPSLPSLEKLTIKAPINGLPRLPQTLTALEISSWRRLRKLRLEPELSSLEVLVLSACDGLEAVEGLDALPALRHLHLQGCANLELPQPLPPAIELHQGRP